MKFKVNQIDLLVTKYGNNFYFLKHTEIRKIYSKVNTRYKWIEIFKITYEHIKTGKQLDFFTYDKSKMISGGTLEVLQSNYN